MKEARHTKSAIPFIWSVLKRQIYKDRKSISNCLRLGVKMDINWKWHDGFEVEDENVLKLVNSDGCTTK